MPSNVNHGKGLLRGIAGVTPTEVSLLVLESGEFAARSSMGLGASVKVFDNSYLNLDAFKMI